MTPEEKSDSQPAAPAFSDTDKARARQWFNKAGVCRERHEYEYAIECYITGLGYWPEAVEEGHMPLRSLAIQRQQVGGKKPGLMDGLKKSFAGKDAKQGLLNAEQLLAMDPSNPSYADGALKNAVKAGFVQTVKWVAPIVFESLKKDKKPNKTRFGAYRQGLVEAAEQAAAQGDNVLETWLLEHAVSSLDYLAVRMPGDEGIRVELRDLAGKLTIARGKYEEAEDFRESLYDGEKQKLLHDADRVKQGAATLEALIEAARRDWQEAPEVVGKVNALVDALLKAQRTKEEDEAIEVLMRAYEKANNYSFKSRADDIRLRRLGRQVNQLGAQARDSGLEEDKQQLRLAVIELRQVTLEVFGERVEKYPTDMRLKYKLGAALFEAGEYDEAIPMLQLAQADPRSRARCQLLLGRAFFEKGTYAQAGVILREALESYETTDDFSKQLLYWLGRACEADGQTEEAKAAYGKLLRQDYNYLDGDARKRLESLN